MDHFECLISREKLQKTNKIWGNLKLNHPWIIGRMSTIIQQKNFRNRHEFRDYYYYTGQKREEILQTLSEEEQRLANLIYKPRNLNKTHPHIVKLNEEYGRTQEQIRKIGMILYGAVKKEPNIPNLTIAEADYLVKYRVIGETWNGIAIRETNTIKAFEKWSATEGLSATFGKTKGETDIRYEVDVLVFDRDGTVRAGIQIKPESYARNFSLKSQTDAINFSKYERFKEDYGAPVLVIYSSMKGEISNKDELDSLRELLKDVH